MDSKSYSCNQTMWLIINWTTTKTQRRSWAWQHLRQGNTSANLEKFCRQRRWRCTVKITDFTNKQKFTQLWCISLFLSSATNFSGHFCCCSIKTKVQAGKPATVIFSWKTSWTLEQSLGNFSMQAKNQALKGWEKLKTARKKSCLRWWTTAKLEAKVFFCKQNPAHWKDQPRPKRKNFFKESPCAL